jgi:hypothetical protein
MTIFVTCKRRRRRKKTIILKAKQEEQPEDRKKEEKKRPRNAEAILTNAPQVVAVDDPDDLAVKRAEVAARVRLPALGADRPHGPCL